MTGRARALLIVAALPLLAATAGHSQFLPIRHLTPGDVAAVSLRDICTPGYTKRVRDVPVSLKREVFADYGRDYATDHTCCEVDHLISLELGGSNAKSNLWPQPWDGPTGAHAKDGVENRLHSLVCAGVLPLREAQTAIAKDWIAAKQKYLQ